MPKLVAVEGRVFRFADGSAAEPTAAVTVRRAETYPAWKLILGPDGSRRGLILQDGAPKKTVLDAFRYLAVCEAKRLLREASAATGLTLSELSGCARAMRGRDEGEPRQGA